ncbi:MAG: UvrD-helicase domain-containing protein [Bacteroidaceae bacterium]|nr:UvrD-helicase domain-containing protein [Bacteroidaceae bacterium]
MDNTLFIYRASAGAGKTFTLTVEYILLLLRKGRREFEHTLAVTFTNKATAEMKERILETLYGLSHNIPECDGYLSKIQDRLREINEEMSGEMIRQRASDALSAILHDYSHFRVETIDSFFQSVLRSLAHELGLTANMQVELNNEEVISRSVDRVIENMQKRKDVEGWIMDYVEEQLQTGERWNISGMIKQFARCIFEEAFQNRSDEERDKISDSRQMSDFKKEMHSIVTNCRNQLKQAADELEASVNEKKLNFDRISNGRIYLSFLNLVRSEKSDTASNTIYKAASDYEVMLKAKDRNNPALIAQAQQIQQGLSALLRLYEQNSIAINTARLSLRYLNPLRLLNVIEQEANTINAENNQFNLSKTPTLLSKLVEKSDAPFVFEKTGTQFHNVMIDEFQDTSRLQWNNFRVLLIENQSTGGNDLLVGDIKQSIYRWRNGDWAILRNVQQELAYLTPQPKELRYNFRSKKNVIDFNNTFFPKAAQTLDGIEPDARFKIQDIYSDVEQLTFQTRQEGYAGVTLYTKNGNSAPDDYEERMITDMITRIRSLMRQGLTTQDFSILVRKKDHAGRLLQWFHHLAPEIKLVSDEAFLLESSVAVQMLVSALYVLNDTKHLNPVPERYLVMHYHNDVLGQPLPMLTIATSQADELLPEAFTLHRQELAQLPLYLLCERLYQLFRLDRIPGQDTYVLTFMDELQNHLRSNPSDIHTFLKAWDEGIRSHSIPAGEVDGIRILTIHKSKGLQFHTVLLPFMDWPIEKDRNDDTIWCQATCAPFNALGSLPVNAGKNMQQSDFASDYNEEHQQRRVDALNMIYVAFTRAENNLYVWGLTAEKEGTIAIAGDLIRSSLDLQPGHSGVLTYELGQPDCTHSTRKAGQKNRMKNSHDRNEALSVTMTSNPPTLDFMQSNQSRKFICSLASEEQTAEGQQQTYLEIGKLMHYVLSQIEHTGQVRKILNRCMAEGIISDRKLMDVVIGRLRKGFSNPRIAQWFAPGNQVFNECSITSISSDTGEPCTLRPDRVIISGDTITVIDYKFGRPEAEHHAQVKAYKELMRSMYPQKTVEGYLWYIYSGKTEEVKG